MHFSIWDNNTYNITILWMLCILLKEKHITLCSEKNKWYMWLTSIFLYIWRVLKIFLNTELSLTVPLTYYRFLKSIWLKTKQLFTINLIYSTFLRAYLFLIFSIFFSFSFSFTLLLFLRRTIQLLVTHRHMNFKNKQEEEKKNTNKNNIKWN